MDSPKLSIIMPVYNSGKFLSIAVESILSQSFKDFELIMVDDGSTDGSSERCDEYAQADPRVVVIHQKNGGICGARNSGLKIARGEYIGFSDHDDEFLPGAFEKAIAFAQDNDLDYTKYGHHSVKTNGKAVIKVWNFKYQEQIYEPEEVGDNYLRMLLQGKMNCVWDALFKRSFLEKNDLRLNTDFKAGGEDIDFNGRVIACKPKVGVMSGVFYNHYIRTGFSTSTKFNELNLKNAISFPSRLNSYLASYGPERIYEASPMLYAQVLMRCSVGSLLYSLATPACTYTKPQMFALLDAIRNDEAIYPALYKCNKLRLIAHDLKYGLLFIAFSHRAYALCLKLYGMRNGRDSMMLKKEYRNRYNDKSNHLRHV